MPEPVAVAAGAEDVVVDAALGEVVRVEVPAEEVTEEAAEETIEEREAVDDAAGPASLAPQIPLLVFGVP